MTVRKLVALLLVCLLLGGTTLTALAQETSLPDMLNAAEAAIYGQARSGSLLERVARLERDVFGREESGPLLVRGQSLYNYLTGGVAGPGSIILQLNVVEYLVFQNMNNDLGLAERLEQLELGILGTTQTGPLSERAGSLVELVWPSRQLNVKEVKVPAETLVQVRLLTDIDSGTNKVGETVRYRVVRDVVLDDRIVIPAGAEGVGTISGVQTAARFGQGGRVTVDWGAVPTFDGTLIRLDVSERAARHTEELAVAASVAGVILLSGPIGLVGGLLVQGKEHVVPAGTELFVTVARDVHVYGLSLTPVRE